jgi:hypothetical protein
VRYDPDECRADQAGEPERFVTGEQPGQPPAIPVMAGSVLAVGYTRTLASRSLIGVHQVVQRRRVVKVCAVP